MRRRRRRNGEIVLKPVSEEEALQRHVMEYAKLTGHLVFHDYDSRKNAPGLPDLIIVPTRTVTDPTVFFWELKSQRGRLREDQATWLEALQRIKHVEARVIRPVDLNYVQRRLSRR